MAIILILSSKVKKHSLKILFIIISISLLASCFKFKEIDVSINPSEIDIINATMITQNIKNTPEITNYTTSKVITTSNPTATVMATSEIISTQNETNLPKNPTTEPIINTDVFMVNCVNPEFKVSSKLIKDFQTLLNTYPYQVGFFVKSFDGKLSFGYNTDKAFFAASVVKAPYALYCYQKVSQHKAQLTDIIGNKTLEELLHLMLYQSDNEAFHTLRNHFGTKEFNNYMKSLGCKGFQVTTWANASAKDAVIIFESIQKYYQSGDENAVLFMNELLNADWNELKTVLPNDYLVAHKYGITEKIYAETGSIVKENGTSFYIAIFDMIGRNNGDFKSFTHEITKLSNQLMQEYDTYLSLKSN